MDDTTISAEEVFAEALRDPSFRVAFQRKVDLMNFKSDFNVNKATPLKCPACRETFAGTLYTVLDEPDLFVCRKCKRAFNIAYAHPDKTIQDLIIELKEAKKK